MKNLILVLCLFWINTLTAQNQNLINFENEKVQISHPSEWQFTQSPELNGGFFLFSQKDTKDSFKENINLEVVSGVNGLTLKSYALKNIDRLKSSLKNIEILESELITFNGQPAYHLHYIGEMGFLKLNWEKYYFPKDENIFILSSVCEASKTKNYNALFDSILNTFSIK